MKDRATNQLSKEKECHYANIKPLEGENTRLITCGQRQREMRRSVKSPTLQLEPVYTNPDSFPPKSPDKSAMQLHCQ